MNLPDLSYMMKVGQLRYIQSVYETAEYRNPDTLVGDLLPTLQRWGCDLRGRILLAKLRSQPFYYYVVARTKYYDAIFLEAICDDVNFIVNIGCGSDTRAYRKAIPFRAKRLFQLPLPLQRTNRRWEAIFLLMWSPELRFRLPLEEAIRTAIRSPFKS